MEGISRTREFNYLGFLLGGHEPVSLLNLSIAARFLSLAFNLLVMVFSAPGASCQQLPSPHATDIENDLALPSAASGPGRFL